MICSIVITLRFYFPDSITNYTAEMIYTFLIVFIRRYYENRIFTV